MTEIDFLQIFQGVATLFASEPQIAIGRVFLILLGLLLMYLGYKGVLEALLMIPMGFGMAIVNAGVLFFEGNRQGTLFLEPLASTTDEVMTILQIDFLQPIYTFTFSNGLIAVLVFLGIGSLLDVGFVMARPFRSMFLAVCAELGTLVTFPLGTVLGGWIGLPNLTLAQAAATSTIGGADGPMVLFASLVLARDIFVPITVVGYLYLGLTYGGYPYLIKAMVPAKLR
ncbi:MAG: sodium ion-translocating decarboxylase subunit beta, partial [Rhodospirillales bacterium]|nr:sodium ion-translocating decarboxylase subunit beta [Rhodospirillales bacterium]